MEVLDSPTLRVAVNQLNRLLNGTDGVTGQQHPVHTLLALADGTDFACPHDIHIRGQGLPSLFVAQQQRDVGGAQHAAGNVS